MQKKPNDFEKIWQPKKKKKQNKKKTKQKKNITEKPNG